MKKNFVFDQEYSNEPLTEEWKSLDFLGFDQYEVSNLGRVRSIDRYVVVSNGSKRSLKGKILKPCKYIKGYLTVNLWNEGGMKTYYTHRLVALAFIPNPEQLPEVNHKDENKENNCVSNLEWCDKKYNINYGTGIQRSAEKRMKPVACFELNGNVVKIFPSATEAVREGYGNHGNISLCCNGKLKTHNGYQWSYFNEQKQADGCR